MSRRGGLGVLNPHEVIGDAPRGDAGSEVGARGGEEEIGGNKEQGDDFEGEVLVVEPEGDDDGMLRGVDEEGRGRGSRLFCAVGG